MKNPSYIVLLSSVLLVAGCVHYNPDNGPVRLNQVGFAPEQEKTATINVSSMDEAPCCVFILDAAGDTVWSGTASHTMPNPVSGKPRQIVDFSSLTANGKYTLCVENDQLPISNVQFTIRQRPYRELTRAALRAFYHQRASMPTKEPFAEGYARPAGHPDDHVLVHPSAATDERPAGTVISSPGGWYDAGDYNKYIVNSGFTMGVWLMAYELNKAYFDTLNLNIPVTRNPLPVTPHCPDMLSEAMYNLRWMLTMQDTDGGVYHKLTEPDFESFIAPDQCRKPRYVVMKTTAATLDFAASMAMAARVYAPFDSAFTQQATEAAKRAYAWALEHPDVYYDQDAMNAQFKPEITTGAYPDTCVADEFYWAKTELYLLTKEPEYNENPHPTFVYKPAAWGNVAELADIEWMMHPDEGGRFAIVREAEMLAYLKHDLADAETISVFRCPYGNREADFFWGCNSEGCCWRGVECLYAYRLTGDEKYRINAERCLNYILGQNATGYCYVTGFGSRPTSHPHHRLSYTNPHGTIPGFLAGGPNPAQQDRITDGVKYPKNVPADESYLDFQPSYASNEVTINWNVTLFALTAGIDALEGHGRKGTSEALALAQQAAAMLLR
ncbi:MAG: glycoside hydrolase family 9 protein [Paludibacteraceae bacterium]|nr:glycoside hydrolase family 9 protein [Paludibacteraceae bacterium]